MILRLVIVCMSLLSFSIGKAQLTNGVPLPTHNWAIKGKVLPWMAIGTGINYTLGFEKIYQQKNAFGLDFVYNDWSVPEETKKPATGDYETLARTYFVSRAIFLTYKRYSTKIWSQKAATPYLGSFYRFAHNFEYHEPGSRFENSKYLEFQHSLGILVGTLIPFEGGGQVDLSIGPFVKHKNVDRGALIETGLWPYDDTGFKIGLRLGVNLYFGIGRVKRLN